MTTILTGPNGTIHRFLYALRRTLVQPNATPTTTTLALVNRHYSRTNNYLGSFYDVLNVPPDASQSDIKNAYYKLSMLYHPDRNRGSEKADAKFREITDAYEILCNPRTRRAYDDGESRLNGGVLNV